MKPSEYFDQKAKEYDDERGSGLIGGLVKKEEAIALGFLAPKPDEVILDVGCGSGHYSIKLRELGADPYGIDVAPAMVEKLVERGISGEVLNIEERVPKKSFDKALCAGALEFMKNPEQGISNIGAALKNAGIFVAVYPRKSMGGFLYKLFHLSHGIRIKLFSKRMMKGMLEENGFRVLEDRKADPIANVVKAEKSAPPNKV